MRWWSAILAAAAPALLVAAFLAGSAPDDEEFRWGVLSSVLHVRALANGEWPSWTHLLALGLPQPMVPNFNLHPLVPLLGLIPPATWVRLIYVVHTVIGAVGMWQLGAALQLTRAVRAVCVFTFLLATPTLNYGFTDSWPSHYVMWTTAPWLLLLAWRLLDSAGTRLALTATALGLVAGLVLATTHPGHVPVYGIVVLAIALTRWTAVSARGKWLLAAAAIAIAISSPNLLQLMLERSVFDEDLGIVKSEDPLPPAAVWDIFLRPLSSSDLPWQTDVALRGTRMLFFGGPFALLAIAGMIRARGNAVALAVAVASGTFLLFASVPPLTFVSRFHFRDPVVLCAVPLAGLAADYLLTQRRTRPLAALLLVAQVIVVSLGALPFLRYAWAGQGREDVESLGATAAAEPVARLTSLMNRPGRVAYTPQVDYDVSERGLLSLGLGVNALAYRDVAVINGSFKGISTDVLWPDDRLFYGRVRLPAQIAESGEALDLLGVRYLLADDGEPVGAGLQRRGSVRKNNGGAVVLYENPDAGQGAVLTDAQPKDILALSPHPECLNDRLLCMDLSPLAQLPRAGELVVRRSGRNIDVHVEPVTRERFLVLADMFRPGWTATADAVPLQPMSVGPGLLGVSVPAGAAHVRLTYRQTVVTVATLLSWSVLAGSLGALLLLLPTVRRAQTVH